MSEVETIFEGLCARFQKGKIDKPLTFYFSLDDEQWTVSLSPSDCQVKPGKIENADCFFKASEQMFLDVWTGKHVPSITDFMTGKIKSNNPLLLKTFVDAFSAS